MIYREKDRMIEHKFPYRWTLKDAVFTKDKGKVFSCFACGGGSTMGYKLAGFDVIGCLEIDKDKIETYKKNFNPRYAFCQDIREFKDRDDLPVELYNLDILDGSPPCKAFSLSGNVTKEKVFDKVETKYGITQRWDDLFFELCDLAKKLQPKIVVAENVKGLTFEYAKEYLRDIYAAFSDAGYYCVHHVLNASKMGVPQKRERVIFTCIRKDIGEPFLNPMLLFTEEPYINMVFKEAPILYKEYADYQGAVLSSDFKNEIFAKRQPCDLTLWETMNREKMENPRFFNDKYIFDDKVCNTLPATNDVLHPYSADVLRGLSDNECISIATYPTDYDFNGCNVNEFCGRAVPPVMMAQIATRIYEQWLSKMK